jgi:hypothetical protein
LFVELDGFAPASGVAGFVAETKKNTRAGTRQKPPDRAGYGTEKAYDGHIRLSIFCIRFTNV